MDPLPRVTRGAQRRIRLVNPPPSVPSNKFRLWVLLLVPSSATNARFVQQEEPMLCLPRSKSNAIRHESQFDPNPRDECRGITGISQIVAANETRHQRYHSLSLDSSLTLGPGPGLCCCKRGHPGGLHKSSRTQNVKCFHSLSCIVRGSPAD